MREAQPRSGLLVLARMYFDIALWRRGPQDLPAVGILLPLTVFAYVLLSVAVGEALPSLRNRWPSQVFADTAFVALWYWLLLALMQRRERYLQTAAALFGLQTVLAAPTILSAWLLQHFAHDTVWLAVCSVGAVAMAVWTVAAIAHVLRAALERPLALCVLLAFAQMLAEDLVLLAVFEPHR